MMKNILRFSRVVAGISAASVCSCSGAEKPSDTRSAAAPGDSSFVALSHQVIDEWLQRRPSYATDLGIHKYDAQTEDVSASAQQAATDALKGLRAKIAAVDTTQLSPVN